MRGQNEGLQVYVNNDLVGHLRIGEEAYKGKYVRISFGFTLAPNFQEYAFPDGTLRALNSLDPEESWIEAELIPRAVVVPEREIMLYNGPEDTVVSMIREKYKIPSYANQIKDPLFDNLQFRWRAIKLTVDQYEQVFDLDSFSPC